MLRFSDSRNFGRTLAGLGLIVGPIFLVVGQLLTPEFDDDTAKYLQNVADDKDPYLISSILFLIGAYLLIPGALGVIKLMRGRKVTFGQISATLVLIGVVATVGFFTLSIVEIEMADASDRAAMVALSESLEDAGGGFVLFILFAVGVVIGSILLAIAAWRRRVIPVWAAVALLIAPIVGFIAESPVVGAIGFVLLGIGLGSLGLKILSLSDDQWERWEVLEETAEPQAPATEPDPALR